jgi:hypothetical protein
MTKRRIIIASLLATLGLGVAGVVAASEPSLEERNTPAVIVDESPTVEELP